MARTYKSRYIPQYPEKYVGDPNKIICRSSWERSFCKYLDLKSDVKKWASEELTIPYISPKDGRQHRYFPDFIVEMVDGRTVIIEIKPKSQCVPPKQPKRKSNRYLEQCLTYAVNQAKWRSAKEFADSKGVDFTVLTEDGLRAMGVKII